MQVDDFFWNYFPRSVIIFGVGNSSSSHFDKNNFLILGEVQLMALIEALDHQRKDLVLIVLKKTQNVVWVYIMMLIIVICLLIEKKPSNLKPAIKVLTLHLNLVSEVFLMDLVILCLEKCF